MKSKLFSLNTFIQTNHKGFLDSNQINFHNNCLLVHARNRNLESGMPFVCNSSNLKTLTVVNIKYQCYMVGLALNHF